MLNKNIRASKNGSLLENEDSAIKLLFKNLNNNIVNILPKAIVLICILVPQLWIIKLPCFLFDQFLIPDIPTVMKKIALSIEEVVQLNKKHNN